MLIDSHCHLDYFADDEVEAVLARAKAADVGVLVTIGTSLAQADAVRRLGARFANVWGTVGIHPHEAGKAPPPEVGAIVALTENPKIIGIGESGLDYFYNKSPQDIQQEVFRRHIRAAQASTLPLVIHARQADRDILKILLEERDRGGDFKFVLHCFSSGRGLAEGALAIGGYLSFSGILTFPKSQEIRDIARDAPEERVLVETDAPYLAPVPFRGKRCEPAMIAATAQALARLRDWSTAETHRITTANCLKLFDRLRLPGAAAAA